MALGREAIANQVGSVGSEVGRCGRGVVVVRPSAGRSMCRRSRAKGDRAQCLSSHSWLAESEPWMRTEAPPPHAMLRRVGTPVGDGGRVEEAAPLEEAKHAPLQRLLEAVDVVGSEVRRLVESDRTIVAFGEDAVEYGHAEVEVRVERPA